MQDRNVCTPGMCAVYECVMSNNIYIMGGIHE